MSRWNYDSIISDPSSVVVTDSLFLCGSQEARKAQLENHEPEDEEEDLDMDKDIQDSGQFSFTTSVLITYFFPKCVC